MKILIDARSMGTKPSGIGMYIYNFAKELVKEPDMEIHLLSDIATSNEMQAMEQAGAILHCYGTPVGKNFGLVIYYRYLQKVIHEIRPEIFWEGNSLVPIKVTNPYGKFMVTVHDLFPLTMPECFGKKYEYYFRYGLKNTLKYADTFIYNSMETKRDMERIFPQAAKKGSFLSYIIIDRIVHGEIEDNNAFLYVGNLEKRKGTDLLLDGYLEYLKAGGTKDLRFAGKIREADIEEKIRQVQEQTKKATYLGYLTKEDKEREYRQCSAFLFPSRAEGFGMPLLEVMKHNKPILASDLKIFDEVVGNCVERFSLDGGEEKQIKNLSQAMHNFDKKASAGIVDENAYKNALEKFTPDRLGGMVRDFINTQMENK